MMATAGHPQCPGQVFDDSGEMEKEGPAKPARYEMDITPEETQRPVSPQEVAHKMRLEYSRGVKSRTVRTLQGANELLERLDRHDFDLGMFLKDAAEFLSRQVGIATVTIAVWNPTIQRYRFRAAVGLREEGLKSLEKLSFTKDQVFDEKRYPSHEISRHTRLYLDEERAYVSGEESSFARPSMLSMKRTSSTESLEGDYLCVFFYGRNRETLGWIELSGTRMRMLPDTETILWAELIARILGMAVTLKEDALGPERR